MDLGYGDASFIGHKNGFPYHGFPSDKVAAVAAELEAGDLEGWTYKVKHDPKGTGCSLIEIYDEDGEFVALF